MAAVRVQPLNCANIAIRLRRSSIVWSTLDDARWADMTRSNPRLHDGPMAFALDWNDSEIVGEVSGYRRLMLRKERQDRALAIGVTGMLTRRNGAEILMGRRSESVRIYGGLWETAPRGGLDAAPPTGDGEICLGLHDLASRAADEAREEVGLSIDPSSLRAVALVIDEGAGSLDVVLSGEIETVASEPASWEYSAIGWAARGNLGAIGPLSPPTAALAEWLSLSSSC